VINFARLKKSKSFERRRTTMAMNKFFITLSSLAGFSVDPCRIAPVRR
jgi:hypothetical protein